ncbi:aminodeoxychorismate synthase component I [Pseudomonas sp. RL_15y_Pfl2_60]|uniref:aminodeoxychorismate synthase component I n=1 Tax=Pseudomonas sp. RL_15y_Pfl2_60 TaxID=3088709 RepID=UPI0030DB432A
MSSFQVHALPYNASPGAYFGRLRSAPGAILLDTGRPAALHGRYDLMSAWPLAEMSPLSDESAKVFLQRLRVASRTLSTKDIPKNLSLPFAGGLIGYFGYDFGRRLETIPSLAEDDLKLPDARVGLYAWALISDHQLLTTQLVFHPQVSPSERRRLIDLFESPDSQYSGAFRLANRFQANISQGKYQQAIAKIQAYIQAGDCYQVNFAQRFQAQYQGDPWLAYQALRTACPTPFAGFQALPGDAAIISLSPERFMRVSQGRVETRPIKGTRPRDLDPDKDAAQAAELLHSAKDQAENLMIVDLLRNDLGRCCQVGSVQVPELFALESYPNVHHLVSAVTGQLADDKDPLDLLACSFPGGSITGAPKIRAMQIIDELEDTRRGLYCGSLFYLDIRGEMDSSITIRSLLAKDGTITCWGGGGIVADSQWQAEYQESLTKVDVLLRTLEQLGQTASAST